MRDLPVLCLPGRGGRSFVLHRAAGAAGLALQPIASDRYQDRFERRDQQWRFVERLVRVDLVGDVSRHLRSARIVR